MTSKLGLFSMEKDKRANSSLKYSISILAERLDPWLRAENDQKLLKSHRINCKHLKKLILRDFALNGWCSTTLRTESSNNVLTANSYFILAFFFFKHYNLGILLKSPQVYSAQVVQEVRSGIFVGIQFSWNGRLTSCSWELQVSFNAQTAGNNVEHSTSNY